MTPAELLSVYAKDRTLIGLPGYDVERFPHLTCFTPTLRDREGIVMFADLNEGHEAREIDEQIRYFQIARLPFRWMVLGLDGGKVLRAALADHGLEESWTRVMMQHEFRAQPKVALPKGFGLELKHVGTEQGLRDVLAVYSASFGRSHGYLYKGFSAQLRHDPDTLSLFCIYQRATPVAAAWTIYPRGSQFPEMQAAAVVPPWRGRGLGIALDAARVEEAHSQFYTRVMAIGSEDRLDVLERLGFERLATVTALRPRDVSIAAALEARRTAPLSETPVNELGAMIEIS